MAFYPALDVTAEDDGLILAAVDEFSPVAAQDHDGTLTIFFTTQESRDAAHAALREAFPDATLTNREVDDEDWARRSQENLGAITIGRITIAPRWSPHSPSPDSPSPDSPSPDSPSPDSPSPDFPSPHPLVIQIRPSMGFGTGHHATTRLCLAALQTLNLQESSVMDLGTGSGVLAIAARRLGARRVVGIDNDADAVQSARDNLALNRGIDGVTFEVADLRTFLRSGIQPADILTANLTGAMLINHAALLMNAIRQEGSIVVSGLLSTERDEVLAAFDSGPVWETTEDGWTGLIFEQTKT